MTEDELIEVKEWVHKIMSGEMTGDDVLSIILKRLTKERGGDGLDGILTGTIPNASSRISHRASTAKPKTEEKDRRS